MLGTDGANVKSSLNDFKVARVTAQAMVATIVLLVIARANLSETRHHRPRHRRQVELVLVNLTSSTCN